MMVKYKIEPRIKIIKLGNILHALVYKMQCAKTNEV